MERGANARVMDRSADARVMERGACVRDRDMSLRTAGDSNRRRYQQARLAAMHILKYQPDSATKRSVQWQHPNAMAWS